MQNVDAMNAVAARMQKGVEAKILGNIFTRDAKEIEATVRNAMKVAVNRVNRLLQDCPTHFENIVVHVVPVLDEAVAVAGLAGTAEVNG